MKNTFKKISFSLFSLTMLSSMGVAAPLKQVFPGLPTYFVQKYGSLDVKMQPSTQVSEARMKLVNTSERIPTGRGQEIVRPKISHLVVETPARKQFDYTQAAKAFLKLMATSDSQFAYHVKSLEKLGFRDESHRTFQDLQFREKIYSYGAEQLMGRQANAESFVKLWWKLKFSAENKKAPGTLKKGDPILFAVRQAGYFEPSGSFMTNIRRRLDFGHAAIGIRFAGGAPENDLYVNPGSKNFDLNEVTLPNSANPDVFNAVAVENFWKWTEVQLYHRYMTVSMKVLQLNALQIEAIKQLLPVVRGISFGPAIVIKNDCVDGSARLGTFLLPIDKKVNAELIGEVGTPKNYQAKMGDAFKNLVGYTYDFVNIKKQNPYPHTPDIATGSVNIPNVSRTRSFNEYLALEARFNLR